VLGGTPPGPSAARREVPTRALPTHDRSSTADVPDFADFAEVPVLDDLHEPGDPTRTAERQSRPLLARARRFGARHLGAIGVFVVVALVFCSLQLLRVRTDEVPLAVVSSPAASGSDATGQGSSAQRIPAPPSPTPAPLVVHVVGRVARPGIVRLDQGARVGDAIAAAGGLTTGAQVGHLNLAEPLLDGSQVVVGPDAGEESRVRAPGSSGGAAATADGQSSAQLDLNTATAEQFEALPGIGPVTARNIVDWRTQHQRFTSVEELQEVDGIGPKTFQKLAPMVRV
jgi:competence protein ComEA